MHVPKPLIVGVLTVFANGVFYDAAASAGLANGDGGEHTPPRIPVSMAAASGVATSTSISFVYSITNLVTGEEYRIPPRDPRAYAAHITPPASQFIYLVGASTDEERSKVTGIIPSGSLSSLLNFPYPRPLGDT